MKDIILLGSTGSIGTQALEVIGQYPDRFNVVGLSCNKNVQLFLNQVKIFKPKFLAVADETCAKEVEGQVDIPVLKGSEGVAALAATKCDLLLNALVGISGFVPTVNAIKAGSNIALANKETLVAGGDIVMPLAKQHNVQILPVDSEHSAIWQSIGYGKSQNIKKLLLTASGGPFVDLPAKDFDKITLKDALNHPTWNMGAKVTIDSATMMNKGLELIEAMHLFGVDADKIDILINRGSIVHSLAMFEDNSIIAELSQPSMKIPIALALSYPQKLNVGVKELDLTQIGALTFEKPDLTKFECLRLARDIAREGGILPTVMNAANEVAVEYFLKGIIKFKQIPYYISKAVENASNSAPKSVDEILSADKQTRTTVNSLIWSVL